MEITCGLVYRYSPFFQAGDANPGISWITIYSGIAQLATVMASRVGFTYTTDLLHQIISDGFDIVTFYWRWTAPGVLSLTEAARTHQGDDANGAIDLDVTMGALPTHRLVLSVKTSAYNALANTFAANGELYVYLDGSPIAALTGLRIGDNTSIPQLRLEIGCLMAIDRVWAKGGLHGPSTDANGTLLTPDDLIFFDDLNDLSAWTTTVGAPYVVGGVGAAGTTGLAYSPAGGVHLDDDGPRDSSGSISRFVTRPVTVTRTWPPPNVPAIPPCCHVPGTGTGGRGPLPPIGTGDLEYACDGNGAYLSGADRVFSENWNLR